MYGSLAALNAATAAGDLHHRRRRPGCPPASGSRRMPVPRRAAAAPAWPARRRASTRSAAARADRPREEAELADDDRDAVPVDAALARDDRLVGAGALGRGGELGGIRRCPARRRRGAPRPTRRTCPRRARRRAARGPRRGAGRSPGRPRPCQLDSAASTRVELVEPGAHATSLCSPSSGGCRCSLRPPANALSSKRIGGPGISMRPSSGWSTSMTRPWTAGLLPLVDAVERAHLAGGDADLGEPGDELGEAGCRRRPRRASR